MGERGKHGGLNRHLLYFWVNIWHFFCWTGSFARELCAINSHWHAKIKSAVTATDHSRQSLAYSVTGYDTKRKYNQPKWQIPHSNNNKNKILSFTFALENETISRLHPTPSMSDLPFTFNFWKNNKGTTLSKPCLLLVYISFFENLQPHLTDHIKGSPRTGTQSNV